MKPGDQLLIGLDLKKDPAIIRAAYNDAGGFTRDFNLNLLLRINRELGADFDLDRFEHRPEYDPATGAARSFLVSIEDQQVSFPAYGRQFGFAPGETIHTESSYKYTLEGFTRLAERAGLTLNHSWIDDNELFSVNYLSPPNC